MRGKMTDQQLAAAKAAADNRNTVHKLATAANGHGVTRQEARQADAALVAATGSRRKADKAKEAALQRAGARPKGLGRWLG